MEDRVPLLETEVSSSGNALNAPSVSLAEPTLLAGTKSWAEGVAFTALGLFYSESACCTRSIFGSFGGPHDDFPRDVGALSFLQSAIGFQTAKTRQRKTVENSKESRNKGESLSRHNFVLFRLGWDFKASRMRRDIRCWRLAFRAARDARSSAERSRGGVARDRLTG
jgi:hypothetical protein